MAAGKNTKQKDEEKNLIQSYDMLLIMVILKMYTGERTALSISDITGELNNMFAPVVSDSDSDIFHDRTLYRKLNLMMSSSDTGNALNDYINRMLLMLTGGTVKYRAADGFISGTNTTGKGSQRRYYFEPLLTNSDLDMISSAVMSSRYLSSDEKDYLLARLNLFKSEYDAADRELLNKVLYGSLPSKQPTSAQVPGRNVLPSSNSVMLSHIMIIYEAIQEEYRLEVIYGMYDIRENSSRVDFHPRNADKPYILNPYAMMWNDGEYYLIATHCNYENPVHFRIDRIIDVKFHIKERKDKKSGSIVKKYVKRNRIPSSLMPYFHRYNNRRVFDSIAYANKYPEMKIYGKEDITVCRFECTDMSLQILIDNFGSGIHLEETPISHPDNETDVNGRPIRYIAATVTGVQRENAIDFAVEHSNSMTLIGPDELVDEVRERIREIYEKYMKTMR